MVMFVNIMLINSDNDSTDNVGGDVSSEFTLAALPGNRHVKEKREAAYSEV